jgi:uncharacterized protein
MRDAMTPAEDQATRNNSLSDVVDGITGPFASQTIAQPWTFVEGMAFTPFTLNRIALSYGYMSYGLVQAVVDMVVDDAFRGGLEIESTELDKDDIAELKRVMEEQCDLDAIKNTAKWARLYGGAAMLIVTDQNPATKLREIKQGSDLKFIAADRWELLLTALSISGNQYGVNGWQENLDAPYNYYGVRLDASRAVRMLGKEAPSFIRQRLQGWGMSELERCMREINSYIKFQNLLFELVDEAKIDVYKIEQFNEQLATAHGTALIQARIQLSNLIKNYRNALVMDQKDEYEQKQIAFGGLADIFQEFRVNLCSALKIPYNKLFGQSATGFSSGEDSMENYNSMVESDVREKVRPLVREALKLRIRQVFGFEPEFTFAFKPMRVLNETEEEEVKSKKQTRTLELYDRDLLDGCETMESLHKDGLVNVDSDVLNGTREPISPLEMQQDANDNAAKADAQKAKAAGKKKENGLERLRSMMPLKRAA